MNKTTKNIINSFIIVPLVATTLSMNGFMASVNQSLMPIVHTAPSPEEIQAQKDREQKAAKIDAYFTKYNMPLAGYGMKIVVEAEKHNLDWRLIPAIAVRESTGCKFIIPGTNNCFGWGSGKIKFASMDAAIESVTAHLSGDNEQTAHYYDGKSIRGILETYNPPSVVATYADEVMAIMNSIDRMKV